MIEKLILITVFALFKGRINKTILENFNEKNAPRTGSQQKYQEYTREIHFCTKSIPSSRRRILSSYFDEDTPSVYSISKNHHRQNCFFLSIYRALYQNKHIHVHLIHWRSHDICAIFTSSHAVDCTSFLSQTKKSSSNKYPIERDTVSLRKSVYEGKKWRLQHRHCFSIHSRYRYLSLDRFCHRHMIFSLSRYIEYFRYFLKLF